MIQLEGYSARDNEILNEVFERSKSAGSMLRLASLSYDEILENEKRRRRFIMRLMLKAKLIEQKAAAKISAK